MFWLALPARIQSAFALYTKTSNFNFLERAIKKPSSQTGLSHSTHHDCLITLLCDPPNEDCFFGRCTSCPGSDKLHEVVKNSLESMCVEEVTYKQWLQTDRCTLETVKSDVSSFSDSFATCACKLLQHAHIAKEQSAFFKKTKETLEAGTVLAVADFSENYAFVVQDSAQGFHWNTTQATLHPFGCYFKHESGEIRPLNFVIISNAMKHSTSAVYSFQARLVEHLKREVPEFEADYLLFRWGCRTV